MKRIIFLSAMIALLFFQKSKAQVIVTKPDIISTGTLHGVKPTLPDVTITSPTANSLVSGPFVLVGKAKPGATVTIQVIPSSKNTTEKKQLILLNETNLYKAQTFTAIADAKGNWQSPLVEVRYYSNTNDRKLRVTTIQWLSSAYSKTKSFIYKVPQPIKVILLPMTTAFKITSPSDKAAVKGNLSIAGTGKTGTGIHVKIVQTYQSTSYNGSPVKGYTKEFSVTPGDDGNWNTEPVNFDLEADQFNGQFTITATIPGTGESKTVVVKNGKGATGDSPFNVTYPSNGANVGSNTFQIKGTATAGQQVFVEVRFWGRESVYFNLAGYPLATGGSVVNDKIWSAYSTTVDANGEWKTPSLKNVMFSGNKGSVANNFIIKVTLKDKSGNVLQTRKVQVTCMKTKAV